MTSRIRRMALVAVAGMVLGGSAGIRGDERPSIQGVWQVVSRSAPGPDGQVTDTHPEPGLYIFTRRHYSVAMLTRSRPAAFPENKLPTAEELLAVWGPFAAQSGTYALERGGKLTWMAVVAKSPDVMAQRVPMTFTYKLTPTELVVIDQGMRTTTLKRLE